MEVVIQKIGLTFCKIPLCGDLCERYIYPLLFPTIFATVCACVAVPVRHQVGTLSGHFHQQDHPQRPVSKKAYAEHIKATEEKWTIFWRQPLLAQKELFSEVGRNIMRAFHLAAISGRIKTVTPSDTSDDIRQSALVFATMHYLRKIVTARVSRFLRQ